MALIGGAVITPTLCCNRKSALVLGQVSGEGRRIWSKGEAARPE